MDFPRLSYLVLRPPNLSCDVCERTDADDWVVTIKRPRGNLAELETCLCGECADGPGYRPADRVILASSVP